MTPTPLRSTLLGASLLAVAVTSAQAGSLRFTIEAPGVQTSQVTGHSLETETFNDYSSSFPNDGQPQFVSTPSPVGQYRTFFFVANQDAFGGAEDPSATNQRYIGTDSFSYTLDFTQNYAGGDVPGPVGYFGFWWSAGDGNNELIVNMVDNTSVTFSTQSILDSPNLQTTGGPTTKGHFGNPTVDFLGQQESEVFAFVNIYARDANSKISDIEFREVQGGGGLFETDNHTISTELIDPNNQTGADVPVPATALLFGAGLGLIGWTRRRAGRSATARRRRPTCAP